MATRPESPPTKLHPAHPLPGASFLGLADVTTAQSAESVSQSVRKSSGEPDQAPGYELGEEIGRGGMGVVRRAKDLALDRTVAVKILHDRFDPNSATALRFLEEARITAQLQHPGIPAVYHVGRTAAGGPFLAMKLIRGNTLDAILAKRVSEPFHVLAVFEAICQAVGYAHAHDVIHRDLKPANVMVGSFGEVQVMDWGLAKVIRNTEFGVRKENQVAAPTDTNTEIRSVRDTDGTVTQAGLVMGTPAYMSPEQAGGEHDRVDRRADVFGLGGVLCAMLTGVPPYEGTSAESVRLNAVRGETGPALARLDACGAEPEVVALCKRCLSFDPAGRPADADVLAHEIAALRRASDERARTAELSRATAEVHLAEQKKRRRLAVLAGASVAAVLTAGIGGTLLGLKRSEEARNRETVQRKTAEAKEAEATAVLKFIDDKIFSAARPKGQEGGLGREVTLRQALEAALPDLDRDFREQPLVEARLRLTFGSTLWFLGDFLGADANYERAWRLCRDHDAPAADTLVAEYNLAYSRMGLDKNDEAITRFESVAKAQAELLGNDHKDTIATRTGLAHAYESANRHAEALAIRQEIYDAQRRIGGPEGVNTLSCAQNLASSFANAGRHEEALKLLNETVAVQARVNGDDHPLTLLSRSSIVRAHNHLKQYAEAVNLGETVMARQKAVIGADHPDRMNTLGAVAIAYAALGKFDRALALNTEKYDTLKVKLGADNPETLRALSNLAASLGSLNRYEEALSRFEEKYAILTKRHGETHPDTIQTLTNVAGCYFILNRFEKSAEHHAKAFAQYVNLPGHDPAFAHTIRLRLIGSLYECGKGDEARPHVDGYYADCVERKRDAEALEYVLRKRYQFAEKQKDPADLAKVATMWDRLKPTDSVSLGELARVHALAATFYNAQKKAAESTAEADHAMAVLTKAVKAGFMDFSYLESIDAFVVLRGRDEFKKLVARLKAKD